MASTPRAMKQERIDVLCAEVSRLSLCYSAMPPGDARDTLSEEVSRRLDEINHLNAPSYYETPRGQRVAYTTSAVLVLSGLLSSTYLYVALGALVAFFALVVLDGSSDR